MSAVETAPTFKQINQNAQLYPAYLLPIGGTALSLFSAGFHGWNDVIHFARNGMAVDCVDVDAEKLWEMACVYPDAYAYHIEDAWQFAENAAREGKQWDVVSVDPFMGDAAKRVWESIPLWMGLARKLVTITVAPNAQFVHVEGPVAEDGSWKCSMFPRSARASWMVLQRD